MKWCLDSAQFKNHTLYWPTQACEPDMPMVEITDAEMIVMLGQMMAFLAVQGYLGALPSDPNGNCSLQVWSFSGMVVLWPVPDLSIGLKPVTIGPAKYAKVVAAFEGVDAMQTLLRSKMTQLGEGAEEGPGQ